MVSFDNASCVEDVIPSSAYSGFLRTGLEGALSGTCCNGSARIRVRHKSQRIDNLSMADMQADFERE